MLRRGLLERFDLCANLLTSYAGDFGFQNGCNIWHARIVQANTLSVEFRFFGNFSDSPINQRDLEDKAIDCFALWFLA
ncbi:hypothetical protein D9M68_997400 [compost metagenome]